MRISKSKILAEVIVAFFFVWLALGLSVRAEEKAVFQVQAADVLEDGTMNISIYLSGVPNLGGVEIDVVYDPEKVEYVSSHLGEAFTDGYGETHCIKEVSTIKCAVIYSGTKQADGELMNVTFRLKGIESYQPELHVEELLDSSADVKDIAYTVEYQQADGSWGYTQDMGGNKAGTDIIAEVREAYGLNGGSTGRTGDSAGTETILNLDKLDDTEENMDQNTAEKGNEKIDEEKDNGGREDEKKDGGNEDERKEDGEKEEMQKSDEISIIGDKEENYDGDTKRDIQSSSGEPNMTVIILWGIGVAVFLVIAIVYWFKCRKCK